MKPALVISDRDNVATALEPLEAGRDRRRWADGTVVGRASRFRPGHKIALVDIAAGERGRQVRQPDRHGDGGDSRPARTCTRTTWRARAAAAISPPTRACREPGVRLAEPPDERNGVGRRRRRAR